MCRRAGIPVISLFVFVICGNVQASGELPQNQEPEVKDRFSVIHVHQSGDRGCKGWLTSNSDGVRFQGLDEIGKKGKASGVHTLDFPFKIIKEIKKGRSLPLFGHNQRFQIQITTGVTYYFVLTDEKGAVIPPDDLLHAVALSMANR